MLEMFDTILQRKNVIGDVWPKFQLLLSLYEEELDETRRVFTAQRADPPIHDNMPYIAGVLNWSRALQQRIDGPMQRIIAVCNNSLCRSLTCMSWISGF